jgi:hypothetical protein
MNWLKFLLHRLKLFNANIRRVKNKTGKGYITQIYEILVLRFSKGKLEPREYYYFGLYNDRFSMREKKTFLGLRVNTSINDISNSKEWRVIADDKLIFHYVTKGLDLPSPRVYAVYREEPRTVGDIPLLSNPESLKSFIRDQIQFPFFAKPINGRFGNGAMAVSAYDENSDQIILKNGSILDYEDFVDILSLKSGYIFQEYVFPHAVLKKTCGDCLSTVRCNVLLASSGPQIFHAVWKIPTGDNMVDNFAHGERGNLVGMVNIDTGVVERVIGGTDDEMFEYRDHPDTKVPLTGITIPLWAEVVDLCLKAASSFPHIRMQHWDVAVRDDGPVLIELNTLGLLDLHQLVGRSGVYGEKLENYLLEFKS